MARPKPLSAYPNAQFVALVRRTLEVGLVLVPCTASQAASMRGEIYAWRVAVARDPDGATALGIPADILPQTAFRIKPGGLEAIRASDLQTPRLIEAALGCVAPLESEADAALARLRGKLS